MGMNIQGNITAVGPTTLSGAPVDTAEPGLMFEAGLSVNTVTNVADAVIPAAAFADGIILRAGATTAAFSDTTDTAANIYAALFGANGTLAGGGPNTPLSRVIRVINSTGFAETLVGGTGVTISGQPAAGIATLAFGDFLLTVNSPTAITLTYIGGGTY